MSAFRSSSAFVLKTALAVLIVAAMLLVANASWWRTKSVETDRGQWLSVRQTLQGTRSWLEHEIGNTEARYKGLQGATADRIAARLSELSREIHALGQEPNLADRSYFGLVHAATKGELVPAIQADLKLKLLEQERQALIMLKSLVDAAADYDAAKSEVERLRLEHVKANERLEQNKRERWRIANESPNTYRIPGTPDYFEIEALRAVGEKLNEASWAAYRAWEEKSRAFRLLSAPGGLPPFQVERRSVQSVLDPLLAEVDKFKPTLATRQPDLIGTLWSALGIVLAAMLAGVAIKMVLFFLLAPLAARRPAIYLLPKSSMAASATTGSRHFARWTTSAVSTQLTIDVGSELLVKADYLQTAPVTSRTSAKLLLNGQYPLSSLASGMFLLTRVQPSAAESVVVSSTKDPLSEIATIELAEREAVVLQPQHLVGVVHRRDAPVRISSLWRLASLHAWLTLQFRYLVFHGPATLVVKGCRGVRMETAQPGRTISQAATIGFSANLGYSTVRSETFMAYLLGQKALFSDRFEGPNGFFAYQEIPSTDQRSGITGRGLQGVMDGMLKAFGV